jgi:hypothetical protein
MYCEWRKNQKAKAVDENIILAYVLERSRRVKSSSLWSYFFQLKKMLLVKENIDIGRFVQILIHIYRCPRTRRSNLECVFLDGNANEGKKYLEKYSGSNSFLVMN